MNIFTRLPLRFCMFLSFIGLSMAAAAQTPAAPTVSGSLYVCSGSTTTLTATGAPGATFAWYDAATGGNLLSTSASYTTPALTMGKSFYVQQTVSGNTSASYQADVLVAPNPLFTTPQNILASPSVICQGQSSNLSATVDANANQYVYWYDSAVGGNLLAGRASGRNFTVSPNGTKTYYAQTQPKIDTITFGFTGGVQTFTVPMGITSISIDARGARGGLVYDCNGTQQGTPGQGGRVQATLNVTPGQVLNIYVGQHGSAGYTCNGYTGGYNGGGGGTGGNGGNGGGGGGATDIRTGGQDLTNRVLVAGGGGAGSYFGGGGYRNGGAGGGLTGGNAPGKSAGQSAGGGGGSQTAGGSAGYFTTGIGTFYGNSGSLGFGGNASQDQGNWGGGGGGGYYGGGGSADEAGGGGGSSYTDAILCQNVVHTQGFQNGDGQLIITYNSASNCAAQTRQPVTVTVNTTPTVSAGNNVITCAGTGVTITATGADTYIWTPGNLTGTSVSVNPASTTTYTVTGKLNNGGCTNTANVTVTVTSVSASANSAICLNQSTTLSASGADSYTWQPGNLTGSSVTVSPSSKTTYTVTGHNNVGCNTTAQTTVSVNPIPPVSIGSGTTVPAGTSVTLTATGADNYSWSSPYSTNTPSLTFTPAATSTWQVTGFYSATGCSNTATAVVTVGGIAAISGNTQVCPGGTTALTATGTGPFTWYTASTGGTQLYTGATYTTPAINADTAFYVSDNGSARTPVKIYAVAVLNQASATPVAICLGSNSNLSVTPVTQVNWYDAPSNGHLLDSAVAGTVYSVTPKTTTVYYAQVQTQAKTQTFGYSGGVQTFTVPPGITSISIDARGARGGFVYDCGGTQQGAPGQGGRVQATLNVTPGQVLYIYVGQHGSAGYTCNGYTGGYNGGGGGTGGNGGNGGGGGGATDIRTGGQNLTNRVLVAGGGGAGSYFGGGGFRNGGAGGGLTGGNAPGKSAGQSAGGGGGSQTAGGSAGYFTAGIGTFYGNSGSLGFGGNASQDQGNWGGGGGGGYYGGGGSADEAGGGGGSSYTDAILCQNVVHTQGYQNGDGQLTITYSGACAVRLADTVTVNPLPAVKIIASADSVRVGSNVTLTATGATSYAFTNGVQNGISFVPPASSFYKVTGTDNNGCINSDSVYIVVKPAPSISLVSPAGGPVGSLVTISGQNLSALTNISIGGVPAIILSSSSTQAAAMVMPGTTTGGISVTNVFGSGIGGSFTVTPTPVPLTQQGNKFTAIGAVGNAQKGYSVAISADGNTALLGGPSDSSSRGAAWVFTRSNGIWAQQGPKLVGTGFAGSTPGEGNSVALSADGNTAVIGASADSTGNGAVWIFTRSNGTWVQQGNKLKPTDAAGAAQFGSALSISADGNTVLVGGQFDNANMGAGWIFRRSNGIWTQNGNKLSGTGTTGASIFQGFSVALSADGKTALLGGYFDNSRKGAVWVFANSNGTWAQQGTKLVGTGAVNGGAFLGAQQGTSVAISADGNTAFIGGSKDNNGTGAVWVFTRGGSTWSQQGNKLTGTGTATGNVFLGQSLAASADGKTLVAGAPSNSNSVGGVWVFENTNGTWAQQGSKLLGTGAVGNSAQGRSLAISADGTTALAGGSADNTNTGTTWAYIVQPPVINSFTPTQGPVGTVVAINGQYFSGTNNVSIGSVNAASFTVTSDAVITATVATGSTTGNIAVTTAGGTASLGTFTITPTSWTGAADTKWTNPNNWSSGTVPTASDDITIPAGTPHDPVVNTMATVHNITNAATVTVTSDGNLGIAGNLNSTGTVAASAGAITFSGGAAQTINGNITANNFTINNPAGVNIASGNIKVYGTYIPQAGVLTTNGNLVLASTAAGTASVAQSTVSHYVTGNVTVQRYIPAHRAWRFLTAPLSNTGSIYANWQNNGVVTDSTGALIFAPGGGGGLTAGGHTASIESYDPIANNWVNLTNTNSNLLSGTSSSAANLGYGLFVTGPYGSANIASGSAATTLSAAGALQTGQQQFTYSGLQAGAYILVGNPYASPVGFTQVGATGALSGNIANTMWAWDAQRSGTSYGGYVTFSWDPVSSSYDQDIDPSQTKQTTTIQSGQAFFVQAVNNGAATVTFNETDKADASTNTVGVYGLTPTPAEQVRVTLSRKIGDTLTAVDGVLAKFADGYSKGVSDDVAKQFDYDENLSLQIDTNYLAIERRPVPEVGDTLFLNTYALKKNTSYSFTVAPQNLQGVGAQAWLVDNYLNKKTQLSLADSTTVAFSTGGAVASLSQARFYIVFSPNGTLATTRVTLKAWLAGGTTQLQWTAPTEQGIKQYQLERSGNAQSFTALGTALARNSGLLETYTGTDAQPFTGDNYYRIKIFNTNGTTAYSNVVLVKIAPGTAAFSVYPNPVQRGRQLTTLFSNMQAGKYSLQVYGNNGKLLTVKPILHDGVTITQTVTLPFGLAGGTYRLVLLDGNGKQWKVQLAVE